MRYKIALLFVIILAATFCHGNADTTRAQQLSKNDSLTGQIYVLGAVVAPRAIVFKSNIYVSQAVEMAGGVGREGGVDRIHIIRGKPEDTNRTIIVVDLKAILKHKAEDICLQPNDVVEVLRKRSSDELKKKCPHPPCTSVVPRPGDALKLIYKL
ncbi:MAG TPA: SLBB domain-containing protein [Pyrinomonadaceae bacterium]|jgi:hypothetical protein